MTPRPHGPEERELAADVAINERGLTNFERMARAEARVEELEAALRMLQLELVLGPTSNVADVHGDDRAPSGTERTHAIIEQARRALRGSVPEDDDV